MIWSAELHLIRAERIRFVHILGVECSVMLAIVTTANANHAALWNPRRFVSIHVIARDNSGDEGVLDTTGLSVKRLGDAQITLDHVCHIFPVDAALLSRYDRLDNTGMHTVERADVHVSEDQMALMSLFTCHLNSVTAVSSSIQLPKV